MATGIEGRPATQMLAGSGAEVVKVSAPKVKADSRFASRLAVDSEGAISATLDHVSRGAPS